MEKEDLFPVLIQQLETMQKAKKVDDSVIKVLDELIESCKEKERFMVENEAISAEDSFLLYHVSRNSRLVLEKMKERFKFAAERHENPTVVDDSLSIVPLLSDLCSLIVALTKRRITPELRNAVQYRLRALRDAASTVLMLASPEEEIRALDRRKFKRRFDDFAENLQAMFVEM